MAKCSCMWHELCANKLGQNIKILARVINGRRFTTVVIQCIVGRTLPLAFFHWPIMIDFHNYPCVPFFWTQFIKDIGSRTVVRTSACMNWPQFLLYLERSILKSKWSMVIIPSQLDTMNLVTQKNVLFVGELDFLKIAEICSCLEAEIHCNIGLPCLWQATNNCCLWGSLTGSTYVTSTTSKVLRLL